MIWVDEVYDEHNGGRNKEAAGHQRWGGQPQKVLARGIAQTGLFQGQNRLKKEKFYLNIHDVSIYMARTVRLS